MDPISEEIVETVKDLIQLEEHLEENIKQTTDENLKRKIREVLDEVREIRKELEPVKHNNPFHCATKHILSAEKHIGEIWTREQPKSEKTEDLLRRATEVRKEIIEELSNHGEEVGVCVRCMDDLWRQIYGEFEQNGRIETFKNSYVNKLSDGDKMAEMDIKAVGMIAAGQVVGRLYASYVNPEIDKIGTVAGQNASTITDIVLGVALPAISLYVKEIPEDLKLVLVSLGTQRLIDGAFKLVTPTSAKLPITEVVYSQPATVQAPVEVPVYEERYPFFFAR
jgi:hypothetical protein